MVYTACLCGFWCVCTIPTIVRNRFEYYWDVTFCRTVWIDGYGDRSTLARRMMGYNGVLTFLEQVSAVTISSYFDTKTIRHFHNLRIRRVANESCAGLCRLGNRNNDIRQRTEIGLACAGGEVRWASWPFTNPTVIADRVSITIHLYYSVRETKGCAGIIGRNSKDYRLCGRCSGKPVLVWT